MSGRWWAVSGAILLVLLVAVGQAASPPVRDVVAIGILRPLQIVMAGRSLVVLSSGRHGDTAGEVYRFELADGAPVDLSRHASIRLPYIDGSLALGSLAIHPSTGDLFLGEENGSTIYRLEPGARLHRYAIELNRLGGGSTIAFDREGRLVVLDYVIDPRLSAGAERGAAGLEQFRDEDYRGPLVVRLGEEPAIPLPRRMSRVAPFYPRAWGSRQGGGGSPHLVAIAPLPSGDLACLASSGQLFRLTSDSRLSSFARLPPGQYTRVSMVAAPDGGLLVSGGFHVGSVFRVMPDGAVRVLARDLADPEGIAVDGEGDVYVAEASFHRIIRIPGAMRP